MPITSEQFEELPDFVKSDYVEHDGEYVPQAELKVKGLKTSLDNLDAKYKDIESKMTASEQAKADEIQAARDKALAEAESKGDVAAIKERYEQQMEDLTKRIEKETRESVTKEMSQKQAETKAAGLAETIAASKAVDDKAAKSLKKLISDRVKIDADTGKEYFLDDDGGALSVDRAGFEKLVLEEYPHLVKATVTTSGTGGANGNNGGGASNAKNLTAEDAKKKGDLNGFLSASIKL